MTVSEKVAYIKGLAENAGFEDSAKDKVVKAIIDVLEDIAAEVAQLLSCEMQQVAQLTVPLIAEAKFGKTWYEAK